VSHRPPPALLQRGEVNVGLELTREGALVKVPARGRDRGDRVAAAGAAAASTVAAALARMHESLADAAEGEIRFRRTSLFISLAVIALARLALMFKIRAMEKQA
jgi:hypothetical protein